VHRISILIKISTVTGQVGDYTLSSVMFSLLHRSANEEQLEKHHSSYVYKDDFRNDAIVCTNQLLQ